MQSNDLSREFWNFSFENPEKIKPNHIAMYFFVIEHCNRLGWKSKFGFPTTMVMDAISIKSYNTYSKTLQDLVDFGFIKMIEKSKNQYSSNIIALSKNNKAQYKALDKAIITHSVCSIKKEQSTVQSTSESTVQSIDSIDKPIYQYTNLPNNFLLEKETKVVVEEILENEKLEFETIPNPQEKEKEKEKSSAKKEKENLVMPEAFIPIWEEWSRYRKARKFKNYAAGVWEQKAVNKLLEYSNNDPETAKEILNNTYHNNYQGFFPLKQNNNGKSGNYQSSINGTSGSKNKGDKVSGTKEILSGARYTEFA